MFNKNYWIQRKIDRLHIKSAGYTGEMAIYESVTSGLGGWELNNLVLLKGTLEKNEKRIEILTAKLGENK